MDRLTARARVYLDAGYTPLRAVRRLRHEFPHTERDMLWNAVLPAHRKPGLWTEHNCIRPVVCRFDRRPDTPPMHPLVPLEQREGESHT